MHFSLDLLLFCLPHFFWKATAEHFVKSQRGSEEFSSVLLVLPSAISRPLPCTRPVSMLLRGIFLRSSATLQACRNHPHALGEGLWQGRGWWGKTYSVTSTAEILIHYYTLYLDVNSPLMFSWFLFSLSMAELSLLSQEKFSTCWNLVHVGFFILLPL